MICKHCGRSITKGVNGQYYHSDKPNWIFPHWKEYGFLPHVIPYASGYQKAWCTPIFSRHCVAIRAEHFSETSELYDRLYAIQCKKPYGEVDVLIDAIAWIRFCKMQELKGEKFVFTSKVHVYFDKIVYRLRVDGITVLEFENVPTRFPDKETLLSDINRELTIEKLEESIGV